MPDMEPTDDIPGTETPAMAATRWHYLLVIAAAVCLLLPALGEEPLGGHEIHVGMVARSMLDRDCWISPEIDPHPPANTLANHWLVPVENGVPRLNKTPLMYWCAAALSSLTGQSTVSVRGSAVIAAVVMGLTVLWLGRRMFNPRTGLLCAMILVTSMGFIKWGRDARPEMLMACLSTIAMAAFYKALNTPGRWRQAAWMLAAWVAMGLSNLAKEFVPVLLLWPLGGYVMWRAVHRADELKARRALTEFLLLALALVVGYVLMVEHPWMREDRASGKTIVILVFLLPLAWLAWRSRPWRAIAGILPTAVPGAILMGAMFIPWLLYMKHTFPETAARVYANELTDRVAASGRWVFEPAHLTLQSLFEITSPWCVLLPVAVAAAWVTPFRRHREPLVFLLLWVGGLALIWTVVAVKRVHYMLPGLPAGCMLIGYILADGAFEHRWLKASLMRWCGALTGAVGPILLAVLIVLAWQEHWSPQWTGFVYVAAAAQAPWVISGVLAWRGRLSASTGLLVVTAVILGGGGCLAAPVWNIDISYRDFGFHTRAMIPPADEVWWWGDDSGTVNYYFGRDIPRVQWRLRAWQADLKPTDDKGTPQRRFDDWMKGPRRPEWLFVRASAAGEIPRSAYRLVYTERDDRDANAACSVYRRSDVVPASGPATSRALPASP